jgi:hypothetical protein
MNTSIALSPMAPSPSPYRDDGMAARIRYEELLAAKRGAALSVGRLAQIEGRRVGRIAGGIAGIIGFGLIVMCLVGHALLKEELKGEATVMLFAAWGIALVVYVVASKIAEVRFGRAWSPPRSKDVWADIERLEGLKSDRALRREVDQRELWSVALPMMAFSLLAPLTLHALLFGIFYALNLLNGASLADVRFGGFDYWIALSLALVGHAHLVFAGLCYRYAKKVRETATEKVFEMTKRSDSRTFWWTILASAIPGGLLYLIPPLIALFTGSGISWMMFRFMGSQIVLERSALEVA